MMAEAPQRQHSVLSTSSSRLDAIIAEEIQKQHAEDLRKQHIEALRRQRPMAPETPSPEHPVMSQTPSDQHRATQPYVSPPQRDLKQMEPVNSKSSESSLDLTKFSWAYGGTWCNHELDEVTSGNDGHPGKVRPSMPLLQ